jgi:putative flippase GtrA
MELQFERLIHKHTGLNIKSEEFVRITRFVFVGVLNTIVGYVAFFILSYFFYYLLALVIAHFIGVTHSYLWNKYWTFRTQKNQLAEFIRFNMVYLVVLIANILILGFLVDTLKYNPRIGQIIVLPITTMISYFGHKYWSFSTKKTSGK